MRFDRSRWSTASAVCVLTLIGLLGRASAQDAPPATWDAQCNQMRANDDPDLASTYQAWPEVGLGAGWAFTYRGVALTVPTAAYDRVSVSRSLSGWESTLHDRTSGVLVMLLTSPDVPMSDVWATTGAEGEVTPTEEGTALTNTLFGGPVTSSRLLDLGFQHTPRDLTCAPEAWRTEMAAWLVLVMKSIASSGGTAYRAPGGAGWIITHTPAEFSRVQLMVPQEGVIADITVSLPAGVDPLPYAAAPGEDAPGRPAWLSLLEAALAGGSDEVVNAAVETIRAAGVEVLHAGQ